MSKYTIKPYHHRIGMLEGSLFFMLNDKLLSITMITPNYNDYNELRLCEVTLSTEPYDDKDNGDTLLDPLKLDDIVIDSKGLRLLELLTLNKYFDATDEEVKELNNNYPDLSDEGEELSGIFYKDHDSITIYNGSKEVLFSDWEKRENKTCYEKIFYPILNALGLKYYDKILDNV